MEIILKKEEIGLKKMTMEKCSTFLSKIATSVNFDHKTFNPF